MQKKDSSNGQGNCDLKNTTAKDFDGHTAFPSMTAEEKLLWLSNAASFVHEVRAAKAKARDE